MGSGIRAEIRIDPDGACSVATAAAAAGTSCHSINRSVSPEHSDRRTVEFTLGGDTTAVDDALDADVQPVFDYGDRTAFRLHEPSDCRCPCSVIEAFDCPLVDQYTHSGDVFVTFHVEDVERLQALIGRLRETFPSIDVKRLLRSAGDADDHDLVYVDRNALTDRQREALELAHRLGYFEHPKEANAGDVAEEMGVNRSTFSEHLAAAQSKLLDAVLEE